MSEKIVDALVEKEIINLEDKELYLYGIEQGAFILLSFFSALLISMYFGVVLEYICFLVVFIPVRTYGGGYHSESPIKCYILSTLIIVSSLMMISIVSWTILDCVFISFSAEIVIFLCSPIESINKPLTDEEKIVYKRYVLILLILTMISIVLFWNINQVISISSTVALISVMMLSVIHNMLDEDVISDS
jgi:accessory gene regulator B